MCNRIKTVRNTIGMTQQEFAQRLGISRNNIASYETGKSNPGESVIALICREYRVNEHWLRTGEGEMFLNLSPDEEIAAFIGDALSCSDDSFKKRLMSALAKLDDRGWDALEKLIDDIVGKKKED